jgi:hypothetical protein
MNFYAFVIFSCFEGISFCCDVKSFFELYYTSLCLNKLPHQTVFLLLLLNLFILRWLKQVSTDPFSSNLHLSKYWITAASNKRYACSNKIIVNINAAKSTNSLLNLRSLRP